jgi:hypothetical protein
MPAPPKQNQDENRYGSRKYRRQADRLNREPLNQQALKALKQSKVEPDPNLLHAHQLMLWALETGQLVKVDERLEQYVHQQELGPPEVMWDLLTRTRDHDPDALPLNLISKWTAKSPAHLAAELLEQVQSRMLAANHM